MKYLAKISSLLFFMLPLVAQAQLENLGWVVQLTEEIVEETDFCERCTWVNPTISFVRLNTSEYVFLRYSCSTQESFARMYNLDGTLESECVSNNGVSDCGFGGNAFTIYTFADTILPIWNCTFGFDCAFALENNIDRKVPIAIDDTRCAEGIKVLKVSDEFVAYNWLGNNQSGNTATLEIKEGGNYSITVTDDAGCTFDGMINIPDIEQLNVTIKGPAQFCLGTEAILTTVNFQSYEWSSGETEGMILANQAGMYQVTVTNDQDCKGTASFLLENFDPLALEIITNQTKVFEGNPVNIRVNNRAGNQAFTVEKWTSNSLIDCNTCLETTYFPKIDNELMVDVIDENGCKSTTNFTMLVEELPLEIYVPNIFKPSSIIGNNRFTIYGGADIQMVESLAIFDRWGNLVYTQANFLPNQITEGWDGRINNEVAKQDVYLYQTTVLFINGERKVFGGDVLLMR